MKTLAAFLIIFIGVNSSFAQQKNINSLNDNYKTVDSSFLNQQKSESFYYRFAKLLACKKRG